MLHSLETFGVHALDVTSRLLPRSQGLALGRSLGRLAWRAGLRRAVSLDNVRRALGEQLGERAQLEIALRAYEHLGMLAIELLQLPRMSPQTRRDCVEFVGRRHLDQALARGRGAIVASAHYGNWEFLGAGGVAHDLPVTFVVQSLSNAKVDALLRRTRTALGVRVVERGMALRRLRDEVAANRLVAIMCDQDARRRGVFVPFFGTPASTHKGAAQLAIRLDTPFIPLFGRRLADGRHRMLVRAPIPPPPAVGERQAVLVMMSRFNRLLEEVVREEPGQYLWMHRRWKTVPPPAGARGAAGSMQNASETTSD
jgi:KDO2-lipid IV(A) lauroyltransferase